jgi:hypothetical protein
MSILSTARTAAYTGNGTTHTFSIASLNYADPADLVVKIDGVTQVSGTDYEVLGTYPSQSIHFIYWPLGVKTDNPPANGAAITVARFTPQTQPVAYRNQGQYFAKTHETSYDRLCMIIQDLYSYITDLQNQITQLTVYAMIQALTTITETEVLLVTSGPTALPVTPMAGRLSIEIQNNGPNPIVVGSVSGTMKRVLQNKETWTLDYSGAMWGQATVANQITGAATVVTEGK